VPETEHPFSVSWQDIQLMREFDLQFFDLLHAHCTMTNSFAEMKGFMKEKN
jgi:hypothetical protein